MSISGVKGGPGWKPDVSEVDKKTEVQGTATVKKADAAAELATPGMAKLEKPLTPQFVPASNESLNEHHAVFAEMAKNIGARGDAPAAKYLEITHERFELQTSPAALPSFLLEAALKDVSSDLFGAVEKSLTQVGVAVVKAKDEGALLSQTEQLAQTVAPIFSELRAVSHEIALMKGSGEAAKLDALTAKAEALATSIRNAHAEFGEGVQA